MGACGPNTELSDLGSSGKGCHDLLGVRVGVVGRGCQKSQLPSDVRTRAKRNGRYNLILKDVLGILSDPEKW